jgi:transcriptional regulator with XRE-family HTH domain
MAGGREELERRCKSEFGTRLRRLREEARLSQMTLATTADLHPTYISSIERGKRNVSLVNIYLLAEALGVEVADFFPRSRRATTLKNRPDFPT